MADTTIVDIEKERIAPDLVDIVIAQNAATLVDEETLKKLATKVKENYDEDFDSMREWSDSVEEGRDLMQQDFESRDTPWEGAANFKSPMILNATLQFGDTASQELLRKDDVCKPKVIGKDPEKIKFNQASRVSDYINYQVNVKMPEWRTEHDKLLYVLPSTGCMFKKTFFNPDTGRNESDVIYFPNFVVNQSNTTIEEAASFTQIEQYTQNDIETFVRSGLWIRPKLVNPEGEATEQPADNTDRFFEQFMWFDLDDDGYEEPYIVTMHEATQTIVRIVARFELSDVNVTINGSVNQDERIIDISGSVRTLEEILAIKDNGRGDNIKIDEVVSIKPRNFLTKYDFIPDPVGGFLGLGYPHLLCAIAQAVNTTTNHLLDAGTLSNLPGGYLAKGVRKRLGEDRFKPGEWKGTNVPARDFNNAFFPLPYGEPSATLFQLNEKMQGEGERTANSADFSKVLANNAPATTTLALLQKESQSSTSIMRRVYRSMTEEFKKMAELIGEFGDPEDYFLVLDDPQADFESDFALDQINFVPVANPEMSTRIERVKSAEVQMGFIPQIVEAGGQSQPVVINFLEALGVENVDQIFPEPQQAQIDRNTAAIEEQNRQLEFQNGLFDRELQVREFDLRRKVEETKSKIAETRSKILNIQADMVLTFEKAETEAMANQITIYTQELDFLVNVMKQLSVGARDGNNRTETQTPQQRNQLN